MKKLASLLAQLLARHARVLAARSFRNTITRLFAVAFAVAILTPVSGQAAVSVLFYGPNDSTESPFLPTGATFTVASETTWRAMTTSDFAQYALIIIGDPMAGSGRAPADLLAAYDTRNTWAAAVTGRIVVSGMDPAYHAAIDHPGAGTHLTATLDWLTKGPVGKTALYVASDWGWRNLDFLSPFGAFGSTAIQADAITITSPSHPIMIGSTSASLSDWQASAHSVLTYPASFSSLATGTDFNFTTGSVVVAREAPPSVQALLQGKYDTSGTAFGVAVSGNYAYVADFDAGLQVIDVRSPAHCVRVGGYATSGLAQGVAVSGNYAYVAETSEEGFVGLQVIDVSNPTNCVRVGGYPTSHSAFGVVVSGNYAYVADFSAGLQVIDVSDPTNCVRVGGYDTSGAASGVSVLGNYAYVADFEAGLQVIDVSNPTNCVRVGGYDTSGLARNVAVSGNYAYVADWDAGLQVIDVSNPTNCVQVGGYDSGGYAIGVAVSGNYAYVADYAGLQVIDVSNPTNCVRVGGYDTSGTAWGVTVVADRIYLADGAAGLGVLPTLPNVQFTVRVNAATNETFTLEAATNLSLTNAWTPLLTTNVPAMPFDYVDFDVKLTNKPTKFYRIRQP